MRRNNLPPMADRIASTGQAVPAGVRGRDGSGAGSARGYRWSTLRAMVLRHRGRLLGANLIALLATLAAVPVPLLIPLLVDEVLLQQPGAAVAWINRWSPEGLQGPLLYIGAMLLATLLLRLLALGLNVWQTRQFTLISKSVVFAIRRSLLRRLQRVSMAEYETLGSGTVASHLVTDLETIDQFISITSSKFLVALLSIVGAALVLLWMHWQLALFILLLNPLVIYATVRFGRKVKQLKKSENRAFQQFQESLGETLDAIQQIRASNRESHYIGRIVAAAAGIRDHSAAFAWRSDAASRLSFMIFLLGFDLFRGLSMVMVLYSDLTIGEMLAVFAYLWFMMGPVQEVLNVQYAYQTARAALQRINGLMDMRLEPSYPARCDPFAGRTTVSVQIEGLGFGYGSGPSVLDGLSLQIPAGQKLALVGASGSGKTTLVQLLLGLYLPRYGRLCFDGVPVEEIGLQRVRQHVASVLQHPALFNDSLRANLTLGREVDDALIWEALRVARLERQVTAMASGLDTRIGRAGVRLSGGQRQRLAVARMILAQPRVVILDEATSALDSATEHELHLGLREFLADRTTIIVAHRLSAVLQAQRVVVLEDGRIVEDGAPERLMANHGFARIFKGQLPP